MQSQQTMGDRELMEDILLTSKQLSTLYTDAAIESCDDTIHNQFMANLNDTLDMQHQIFCQMQQKGWYPKEKVDKKKINKVKKRFSAG